MASTADIFESALALSQRERASLALRILESLEADDDDTPGSDAAFEEEVADRVRDVESGAISLVDGSAFLASLRRELGG